MSSMGSMTASRALGPSLGLGNLLGCRSVLRTHSLFSGVVMVRKVEASSMRRFFFFSTT